MANTPQARKRIRQTERRTAVNTARRSRVRTFIKNVELAIEGGNAEEAREALRLAQPEIARGVHKGVVAKSAGSRKISRLNRRIKALSA